MVKNPVKPGRIEPGLFRNFVTPKFTTKTYTTTITEQFNAEDEIGKFLQTEHQPILQDIEHQLTPRPVVSEKTVTAISRKPREGYYNVYRFYPLRVYHNQTKYQTRTEARLIRYIERNGPQSKKGRENALCEIVKRKWSERELFQFVSEHNKLVFEQHYLLTLTWSSSDRILRYRGSRCEWNHEFAVWSATARNCPNQGQKIRITNPYNYFRVINRTLFELEKSKICRYSSFNGKINAFWRDVNFDLKVACIRMDYDSEDESEQMRPSKTTKEEHGRKFGVQGHRQTSPPDKRSRFDSSKDRINSGDPSRERFRSRDYQGHRDGGREWEREQNYEQGSRVRSFNRDRGRSKPYQNKDQTY
ncbi:MAG: hypothetical protein EZS28_009861 [Streblomastix strix]|uniref:Uncharacterized protein n=1 Tax=Streblomastix strix TaxID=222440 RepID=A0A5J4WHS7_9EUKA|nr:MAG: hypothetical protein EZS28_009861 [Streblomastix strix]